MYKHKQQKEKNWKMYSLNIQQRKTKKNWTETEQGGRAEGGHGVLLPPRMCPSPAESGQEYQTSGKEYIEPCKTW